VLCAVYVRARRSGNIGIGVVCVWWFECRVSLARCGQSAHAGSCWWLSVLAGVDRRGCVCSFALGAVDGGLWRPGLRYGLYGGRWTGVVTGPVVGGGGLGLAVRTFVAGRQ